VLPQLFFNENEILAFALVLIRISVFLLSWPVFSVYNVPNPVKVLLAVLVAMILFPVIDRSGLAGTGFQQDIAWLAGKEVLTGLCLGFMTRLFFFGIAIGGNLIAMSAGLANGQIFNPALGATGTTIEQFYSTLATLLFLSMNGHHYFLTGLAQSFDAIPLALAGTEIASFGQLSNRFQESGLILQSVMEAGIKIAAPVMIAVFLMNIVMGIIGRAVPQVNVLITSMPVNYMAALLVMIVAIPALILELDHQLAFFVEMVFKFMKVN
jgi:flagellar biosynthesis protein FliR